MRANFDPLVRKRAHRGTLSPLWVLDGSRNELSTGRLDVVRVPRSVAGKLKGNALLVRGSFALRGA